METQKTILSLGTKKDVKRMSENTDLSKYFEHRGSYTCPDKNDLSIFPNEIVRKEGDFYIFVNNSKIFVSKGFLERNFTEFMSTHHTGGVGEHMYQVYKTVTEGISDYDIIGNFIIVDLTPLSVIFYTINHLIKTDIAGTGMLYELSASNKQVDLNLGYYMDGSDILKVVLLRRKERKIGCVQEYYILENEVPGNPYNPNHYFLI